MHAIHADRSEHHDHRHALWPKMPQSPVVGMVPMMLWMQAGASFIVWVAVGLWGARRFADLIPNRSRWLGTVLMVLGAVVMLAALYGMSRGKPLVSGELVPWAWATVTFAGTIFVTLQALGCLLTLRAVSFRETAQGKQASESQESE